MGGCEGVRVGVSVTDVCAMVWVHVGVWVGVRVGVSVKYVCARVWVHMGVGEWVWV